MLNPIKENSTVEIIDRVLDSDVHEQQDEIFAQASKKVSLSEFVADDVNDNTVLDNIEECNKELDNLVVISYEDDLQHIHTIEDQSIQDSLSDSSYVSCAEMFFQEEICSSICSEIFEAHEHTFTEAHDEGRSEFEAKDTLFFQQEVAVANLHVFHDPLASLMQPVVIVFIAAFSDEGDHGQLCFWMISYRFVLLTRRSNQENQSRRHLLDWLHWHFDIV